MDALQLNFEPAAAADLSDRNRKRKSKWQRRKDIKRRKQGDVPPAQPPNKQVRPVQAPSRTARPSNQLKGYELEADRAQPGTKGSTALGPSGGAVQNQSGSNRLLASPASLPSLEQPRTLQQGERRSSQREPASRSRKVSGGQTGFVNAATKEADSLKQHQHQHEQKSKAKLLQAPQLQPQASSGEEAEVMEAIRLSRSRDAAVEASLARSSQAEPDSPEVKLHQEPVASQATAVTFPNANQPAKSVSLRKRQARRSADKGQTQKSGKSAAQWAPGELTHPLPLPSQADTGESAGQADSFEALGLAKTLASHLEDINFQAPTGVQQAAIPTLLEGRDALIKAPTGSGKTLVYLAPIVHDLQGQQPRLSRGEGTHAVVLVPTRELCLQVCDVLTLLLRRYHWLVGGAVYGGESRSNEKARLRRGVTILVATPGRLQDHLQNTAAFRSHALRWVVLDEADRLLDLGFEQKIGAILQALDERAAALADRRRQTVLLSATLHDRLGPLVSLSLQNPVAIGFNLSSEAHQQSKAVQAAEPAGSSDEDSKSGTADQNGDAREAGTTTSRIHTAPADIPKQLRQHYLQVPAKQRLAALAGALRRSTGSRGRACKVVVFMSSCDAVEFAHQLLGQDGPLGGAGADVPLLDCPLWKLHGNMVQTVRTQAFLEFGRCKRGLLICTDVAARGLDFPAVTHIVQFDPPGEPSEYVHRVGRTARMGQAGEAMLFLLPSEIEFVEAVQATGTSIHEADLLPLLDSLPAADANTGVWKGARAADMHPHALAFQRDCEEAVAEDAGLTRLACDAFRSFVRAYSTHPAALRHIFHTRRLHLGHIAASFGLRHTPTMIGKSVLKKSFHQSKKQALSKQQRRK